MAYAVLLDTCAAIWLMNGDPMSAASREAIATAQKEQRCSRLADHGLGNRHARRPRPPDAHHVAHRMVRGVARPALRCPGANAACGSNCVRDTTGHATARPSRSHHRRHCPRIRLHHHYARRRIDALRVTGPH
jgi:hypothetical protein